MRFVSRYSQTPALGPRYQVAAFLRNLNKEVLNTTSPPDDHEGRETVREIANIVVTSFYWRVNFICLLYPPITRKAMHTAPLWSSSGTLFHTFRFESKRMTTICCRSCKRKAKRVLNHGPLLDLFHCHGVSLPIASASRPVSSLASEAFLRTCKITCLCT